MIKQYTTHNLGIKFNLIFNNMLTIIGGDSGIGKTVLFKALENDSILGELDAICLNYDDITSGIIDITLNTTLNKIIVIDNADVILTPEQRFKISTNTNNQYIIFAHCIDGLHPAINSLAELQIKNHKGKLNYYMI